MSKEKQNETSKEKEEVFVNPIDEDQVAENPSSLPYAHTRGGAVIKPTEEGVIKGYAVQAMEEQTDAQMGQIYDQMKVLAEQAEQIQKRKEISMQIYEASVSFSPIIGKVYHLYVRKNGISILSLVAPEEWGTKMPFEAYRATVKLLADHTWEIVRE